MISEQVEQIIGSSAPSSDRLITKFDLRLNHEKSNLFKEYPSCVKETENSSACNLKRRKLIDLSANERLEVVKMASKKDISYEYVASKFNIK